MDVIIQPRDWRDAEARRAETDEQPAMALFDPGNGLWMGGVGNSLPQYGLGAP